MNNPTQREKIHASLLGGAVGDALGAPIEFISSMKLMRRFYGRRGGRDVFIPRVTDDTQMTLFTVEGILRADEYDGELIPSVHDAYLRWLDTQDCRDVPVVTYHYQSGWLRWEKWLYAQRAPGGTCLSGIVGDWWDVYDAFLFGYMNVGDVGPINPDSKGCGTVMRSAPFGMTADLNPFEAAAQCSYLTHGHPTAALSAGAFAHIIHSLLGGVALRQAVRNAIRLTATYPNAGETVAALLAAVVEANDGPSPEGVRRLGQAWIAEEALSIAVYCALAEPDPRKALLLSVRHPGDSDSTGAICGNLLGAMHGMAGVPATWAARVEGADTIALLADDLADAASVARVA